METRRLGQKTRDLLLLDRCSSRLPGRIIGENGLGDEGIEGEARPGHARMKFLSQRLGRAIGNRCVASLPLRHAVHIAAPIRPPPRANRARMSATARVQGRSHAPGRWVSKGRAEISLSLPPPAKRAIARKGRRRVVVQDTKVLAVVARGAEALCAMGPGRAAVSLVGMQHRNVALSRRGLDARKQTAPG